MKTYKILKMCGQQNISGNRTISLGANTIVTARKQVIPYTLGKNARREHIGYFLTPINSEHKAFGQEFYVTEKEFLECVIEY